MRLTLRTLLAYLDDVLSPDATKVIGQKIQESPMAQLLVSRIREVMRRRRLKAPEVFGPEMGIDPNIIAQYLDNTLPAEEYADVERVLLSSDELLAETASCHQILTLLLGEPKEVSQASRERLYALGPVESSSQLAVDMDTDLEMKSRTPESISTRNQSMRNRNVEAKPMISGDGQITTVPDYLKREPLSKRLVPSLLVATLIVVCLVLFISSAKEGFQQASNELKKKAARSNSEVPLADSKAPVARDMSPDDDEPIRVASKEKIPADGELTDQTSPTENKLPSGLDPTPPSDDFDEPLPSLKKQPGKPKSDTNIGDAVPAPAPQLPVDESNVKSKPIPSQPAIAPEILAELIVSYSSPEGAIVRRDPVSQHWFALPHRSDLKPGDRIANLEPFDGTLEFEKAGVRVVMVGETVAELLYPTPAAVQGIVVARGRIIFHSKPKNENENATIGIAIGEDLWRLELMSTDTICSLDVTVRESSQFEKLSDVRWYQASLCVVYGTAQWTNKTGKKWELHEFTEMNIVPERVSAAGSAPIAVASAPEWTDSAKRKLQPLRKYQTPFEKAIYLDVDRPVEEPMVTIVTNEKNPKIAELAARCLSATDNYAAMVQTLAECDHEEARFAARDGLRQWLPTNPANGPNLKKALQTFYSDVDADAVYRMLWGYSRDDVKGSTVNSLQFTAWMSSPKQEIRELADFWVERLSGRPTEFKALGTQAHRDSQIRRLEEQIHRNNGLIK